MVARFCNDNTIENKSNINERNFRVIIFLDLFSNILGPSINHKEFYIISMYIQLLAISYGIYSTSLQVSSDRIVNLVRQEPELEIDNNRLK